MANIFKEVAGKIKRMVGKMFNREKTIKEIIKSEISNESYKLIDKWKEMYAGKHKDLLHDVVHTIEKGHHKRTRKTINTAKFVTEEVAKLIFTENVEINVDNKEMNKTVEDILSDNRFKKLFQNKIEYMLALGGYVLKGHPEEQLDGTYKIKIKYVSPDNFIPISWDNEVINEAVFVSSEKVKDKVFNLLEFHEWKIVDASEVSGIEEFKKVLVIRNELYMSDNDSGKYKNSNQSSLESAVDGMKRVPLNTLYEDLEEEVTIEGLTQPLFRYIKPNIANNFNIESPLGISIYANSYDTIDAINVAFDSFIREFKLGKRRIIVPETAIRYVETDDGNQVRYFDASDESYVAMRGLDIENYKIQDNTVEMRVEEHIAAIKMLYALLSNQIGFSPDFLSFDGTGVKTATEVISENSKTYQTITSLKNLLEEEIVSFIKSLLELASLYDVIDTDIQTIVDTKIDIDWDDSIISDKYTDTDYLIKLRHEQLVSKRYMLKKILKLTDKQIDEMFKEIEDEDATSQDADLMDILMSNKKIAAEKDDEEKDDDGVYKQQQKRVKDEIVKE